MAKISLPASAAWRMRTGFAAVIVMIVVALGVIAISLIWARQAEHRLNARAVPALMEADLIARQLTNVLRQLALRNGSNSIEKMLEAQADLDTDFDTLLAMLARTGMTDAQGGLRAEAALAVKDLSTSATALLGHGLEELSSANRAAEVSTEFEALLAQTRTQIGRALSQNTAPTNARQAIALGRLVERLGAIGEAELNLGRSQTTQQALDHAARVRTRILGLAPVIRDLEDPAARTEMTERARALRHLLDQPAGLYSSIRRNLTAQRAREREANRILTGSARISDQILTMVTQAETEIAARLAEVGRSLTAGLVLIVLLGATVVGIILWIVLVVAERQIIARLHRLREAMTAIADGEEKTPITVRGPDELGQMASALSVFKSNLREAREAHADLAVFAHAATEQLKMPIHQIREHTDTALAEGGRSLRPQVRDHLVGLRVQLDCLTGFLTNLAGYARAGQDDCPAQTVDLAEMAGRILKELSPARRFRIINHADRLIVTTHAEPLAEVLRHLLEFAIEAHDSDEGLFELDVAIDGPRINVALSDDGPGIPSARQSTLFELGGRFGTEARLGLAIVGKLITHHGGSIWISSDPERGRGTTIHFDWPTKRAEPLDSTLLDTGNRAA